MNTVFPSKTRRLAAKAVVGMLVLVALTCVTTPLTAFACDRPEFATILKGFCQAFKADLLNRSLGSQGGITSDELDLIVGPSQESVKEVLENQHSDIYPDDQSVMDFEKSEISYANGDNFYDGTRYAPNACGQGNRDISTDENNFHSYFYSQEYAGLDVGYIDSMFTDAVRAGGN
jgi:hypothetical protein